MVINLGKNISMCEYASICSSGIKKEEIGEVIITISKEALIGFATNLLWIYDDISESKKIHIHIDPLNDVYGGNQSLGFFLTPDSPSLVVCIGGKNDTVNMGCFKQVILQEESDKKIYISDPKDMEFMEEYELGYNNLADIGIQTIRNGVIRDSNHQIVLNLTYRGLKDFATMLFILADNYKRKIRYDIAQEGRSKKKYNMGILLSEESCPCSIVCDDLGSVYDYVPDFGTKRNNIN